MNEECPALQLTAMRCQHVRPDLIGVVRRELHRRRPAVVQAARRRANSVARPRGASRPMFFSMTGSSVMR